MTHRPSRPSAPFDFDRLIRERLRLESVLFYLSIPVRCHGAEIVVKAGGLCGRVAFLADPGGMRLRVEWGAECPIDESDLERRFADAAELAGLALSLIESAEGTVILQIERAFADGYDMEELADWFAQGGSAAQRLFVEARGDEDLDFAKIPEAVRDERASGNLARPACVLALQAQARMLEFLSFNPEIRVSRAYEPDGIAVFSVNMCGSLFYFRTLPVDDRSFEVSFKAVLGRLHTGYVRALQWLAGNRDSQRVMISVSPKEISERVLSIAFCRMTAEEDPVDLVDHLKLAISEVESAVLALQVWFPHLALGAALNRAMGRAGVGDETAACEMDVFYFPDEVLKVAQERDEGSEFNAYWIAWAARNAGRRDEEVRWLEEGRRRLAAEASDEGRREVEDLEYRLSIAQALVAGRRFAEALEIAQELMLSAASGYEATHVRLVTLESLVGLERFADAEEFAAAWQDEVDTSDESGSARSADGESAERWHGDAGRLRLWRCLAVAGLGRRVEAEQLLDEWELLAGDDIAAREEMEKLLARAEAE
jgi:hypothetical protein